MRHVTREGDHIVYKSPWGEIENIFVGNIAEYIRGSLEKSTSNAPILIDSLDSNLSLTEKGTLKLTQQLAALLKYKYHIKYDDVVCLFANNSIYTPVIHHAILSLGAIVSPANMAYLPEELNYQLSASGSKFLITNERLLPSAKKAVKGLEVPFITINDLIAEAKEETRRELPIILAGDLAKTKHAYYCFSSGTSGPPKGVMTTHFNITSNVAQNSICLEYIYNRNEKSACVLPMSHIYGLIKHVHTMLYNGVPTVVFETFDFELLLKSIADHKITFMNIVPPMAVLFAKSPVFEKYKDQVSSMKCFLCGAAPLGKPLADAVAKRTGIQMFQAYGLTEASPVTHLFSYNLDVYDVNNIGWLVPSMDGRLVTEDGKDAAVGERGEIWLRGPNVMQGYLKNPVATNETLIEGGWLRTGDVAIVDEHGQWQVVDRAKELIKSKGHQVAPAELETILLTHPGVADTAVIGVHVPEEGTELPRAYIVLRPNVDPLEVKKWFDSKVARHKRLWGGVVVIDVIPKSASGKILRRFLRDRNDDDKVVGYSPKSKL